MGKILITIKNSNVIIIDNGLRNISLLSDWESSTKEDILIEYKSLRLKLKGGENIE